MSCKKRSPPIEDQKLLATRLRSDALADDPTADALSKDIGVIVDRENDRTVSINPTADRNAFRRGTAVIRIPRLTTRATSALHQEGLMILFNRNENQPRRRSRDRYYDRRTKGGQRRSRGRLEADPRRARGATCCQREPNRFTRGTDSLLRALQRQHRSQPSRLRPRQ